VFGQNFFIENRGGSGGSLGAEAAARSAPDGYTLFMAVSSPMAVTPAMQQVYYDPIKDFDAISDIGTNPLILSVNKKLPIKSLGEFVAYAKSKPDRVTFGSGGVGTINHLSMTLFAKRAGLQLVHVPYKGGGPAMVDLIGGQINSMFANLSDVMKQAESGTVRMLAVSSLKRIPEAPDIPTVDESGYKGFNTVTWNGLVAPAGTPKEIINKVSAAVARAAKDPEFIKRLSDIGVTAIGDTPEEFAATIKQDVAFWGGVVKLAGLEKH
jgi:tripartite-type tricarboxylate transporter receptor subunit TctC